MAILSTDKKLISFGTDYSAGSGISIIDHTISVIPSAVGKTYSAGPNISIYDEEGHPTISSKDWTQEIDQASSGAVTESTYILNDWVNGQYTGDITTLTNNITALSGDLSSYYKKTETSSKAEISAALDYVSAHAVGDVEVNNYVHNNSATIDEVNSAYQANSASYLTAVNIPESATWNDTSNVVSNNSAQWNQGKTYEGISPIVVNNRENKVSAETWTLSAGNGIALVEDSANNVTRIDCTASGDAGVNSFVTSNSASILEVDTSYRTNSGTFLTAIPSDVATTGDVANLEQTISETYYPKTNPSSFATEGWVTAQGYLTAHQDISNKLDSSAFSSVSGDFLTTAFSIPESATWNEVSNVVSSNSASWNEGKTYTGISPIVVNNDESKISADTWTLSAGDGISFTDDSANKVTRIDVTAQGGDEGINLFVTENSASILNVNNSYKTSSGAWNEVSTTVQTNSAQWAEGGSVSSKFGTITVDDSEIEATNSAIKFNSEGFTASLADVGLGSYNSPTTFTWDNYSEGTTFMSRVTNFGSSDSDILSYSSNTNVTGEITIPLYQSSSVILQLPNATAIQFSTTGNYHLGNTEVTATSSLQVKELAWKSDLPTYTYNSANKLSAINGSALVGNEDYLVQQGFVQNLSSPNGTISVKDNKVEATNSAIKSDTFVEGFVSAYNGRWVYPGNSATLTWANYVPNTVLTVSARQGSPTTLSYSADTGVTGQIVVPLSGGLIRTLLPTDSTSIVIGDNTNYYGYDFTVSAADYYEVGELAWKSDVPTFEAGQGITITQPSAGTVRIGNDETVLWSGDANPNGLTAIAQLSEPISAFDSYEVYCSFESLYPPKASKFKTPTTWELQPNTNVYFGGIAEAVSWKPNENNAIMNAYFTLGFGTNLTDFYCISGANLDVGAANGATATRIPYGAYLYHVYKVVGINRKENA